MARRSMNTRDVLVECLRSTELGILMPQELVKPLTADDPMFGATVASLRVTLGELDEEGIVTVRARSAAGSDGIRGREAIALLNALPLDRWIIGGVYQGNSMLDPTCLTIEHVGSRYVLPELRDSWIDDGGGEPLVESLASVSPSTRALLEWLTGEDYFPARLACCLIGSDSSCSRAATMVSGAAIAELVAANLGVMLELDGDELVVLGSDAALALTAAPESTYSWQEDRTSDGRFRYWLSASSPGEQLRDMWVSGDG